MFDLIYKKENSKKTNRIHVREYDGKKHTISRGYSNSSESNTCSEKYISQQCVVDKIEKFSIPTQKYKTRRKALRRKIL